MEKNAYLSLLKKKKMSKYIKGIINTAGFKEIERLFNEKIVECNNDNVDSGLNATNFKLNVLANRKAAKKMKELLNTIKLSSSQEIKEKISYK